ncbi:MAG: outer membrane lipoprotein carrier protein LolA [Bacteroidales bacterium]|nr:outer membrane lipoprotein carrier protein LolA [Bacteroidales bacterium]
MKKFITFIACFALLTSAAAQNFEGKFTQTKTLKVSGKQIHSQGTITYQSPDQLAMMYTEPAGDYFIIDGPYLRMDLRGISLDVDTSGNKTVRAQRNAILYGVSGKYEDIAAEMDAECTVTSAAGKKHVVLKMRKPTPKSYSGMVLDYDKNGKLTRMVLEEFSGITTEYLLEL